MATERISYTSKAPTTEFSLYADRISQSKSGNYTVVRVYIRAYNRGSTSSYSNYSGSQKATIDSISGSLTHTGNPFLPSGVSADARRWEEGPWDVHIPHKSDGTRGSITLRMALNYGAGSTVVTKTSQFSDFPKINVASTPTSTKDNPDPPSALPLSNITHTGMTFEFVDGDDNNSAITTRQYQYSTSSSFSGAPTIATDGSKIVTRTDLLPGTVYYWRARTKNAIGYSDWSNVVSAATYSGILVKLGGVWRTAIPYVKSGGVWHSATPFVKNSGVWK